MAALLVMPPIALAARVFAHDPAASAPAVEALSKAAGGVHHGFRTNHAMGVLVTGDFLPPPPPA